MLIINFSHPLTEAQLDKLSALLEQPIERVIKVAAQFDTERDFVAQTQALIDSCGLSPEEWQTTPLLINPPSLNYIALALLAELHGRVGYFPPVMRLRPVAGKVPPEFEVAEVLSLQQIRDAARKERR